jgi:glutamine amidotransferase-like uncharacterized protein
MKGTVALFVHQPICAVDSINGIIESISAEYNIKLFSKDEVDPTFFDDVDIVAFPGGGGNSDRFDTLLKWNHDPVKEFLNRGGKYLGICMGAYWADRHYFNILNDVRVMQYIKQPNTDTRRPHPKAMPVNWLGVNERMYFYDGCAFVGDNMDVVATYSNGDAMAIIQNNIGLIGCHPESHEWWYDKSYLKPYWHHGRHHKLLLNFVNELIKIS